MPKTEYSQTLFENTWPMSTSVQNLKCKFRICVSPGVRRVNGQPSTRHEAYHTGPSQKQGGEGGEGLNNVAFLCFALEGSSEKPDPFLEGTVRHFL